MALLDALLILLTVWGLVVLGLAWMYRRPVMVLWREPVFRRPVLVLESDDWGAGPLAQAHALGEIAEVLGRYRDGAGRAPVLSLALVLAVPDGDAVRTSGRYARVGLDDPRLQPVLGALRDGCARGVFALQLHGMEHYWPPTLMASTDTAVQSWLRQALPAITEHLPSPLQSRWVNAGELPSTPHASDAIAAAVAEEVAAYTRIVGVAPETVVPPTFVWTRQVERAWEAQGIRCVVTPGWRYTRRGADGQATGDEGPIALGDRAGGLIYIARSDYFEPSRGRDAAHALKALDRAVHEGRACVLENHRDNFITPDPSARSRHLVELDKLCRGALAGHPGLCFLSTYELAQVLRERDARWLVHAWRECLPARWARLRGAGRLWKLMTLMGLATLLGLVVKLVGREPHAWERLAGSGIAPGGGGQT